MVMYLYVKLIHIISAMLAVGINLSYLVWLLKGKREPEKLLFALKGIKFLDDKIANPSYIATMITGLIMCYIGHLNPAAAGWLFYSLILFGLLGIVGIGFYSPALKKQIKYLQEYGADSTQYKQADRKQTVIGGALIILALAILIFMVIKPNL